MPITITCAACHKQLVVPESLLGQEVSCGSCQSLLTVTDQDGRTTVRVLGGSEFTAIPPALPDPVELPLQALPRSFSFASCREKAFVFRVKVVKDPHGALVGAMEARVSDSGLELRDERETFYEIPPSDTAIYYGGNQLGVECGGRAITLRIIQSNCQQTRLAQDIVLFLHMRRPVPLFQDYRPYKAIRWIALVPMVFAVVSLLMAKSGLAGCLVWLCLATLICGATLLLVRDEAVTYGNRLSRVAIAWIGGLVLILPGLSAVSYLDQEYGPQGLAWINKEESDDGQLLTLANQRNPGVKPVPPDKRQTPPWTPITPQWLVRPQTPAKMQGLVSYWPLNEGKGTKAQNVAGEFWPKRPPNVMGGWWIDGVDGKALLLDGAGDYVILHGEQSMILPANKGFTVAGWVATYQSKGPLLCMTCSPRDESTVYFGVKDGCLQGEIRTDAPQDLGVGGTIGKKINDGVWHHVVLIRHLNGSYQLYLDGEVQPPQPPFLNIARGTVSIDLQVLGCQATEDRDSGLVPSDFCECAVDEFCVFDRALTVEEVQALAGKR